ncbi:heavy metal translocating P-type ATPase [Smaragdicoccus niigatensis]|uniref:heavy metal translocating P-type ATPase n=1 Tax=Smaragdicoccus niigatensis TaxID=359359 RepID=UPI00058FD438|nr:heavy metal translocating P-type ATPase [Smaragdicoccus niigatensis]
MSEASTAILLVVTVAALIVGIGLSAAGLTTAADWSWTTATVVATLPAVWWVIVAVRRGQLGVDAVAVLALVGTLLVGEYLAGALIATMLATGRALESAASRRANKDLRALLDRAPRTARRLRAGGIETVPVGDVLPGDVLAVGPGETIPVDGEITSPLAVLDESALTGEPLHTRLTAGSRARSGAVNAGSAFELRALVTAADSTYAGIVRLAQEAAAESAPVVRLADRAAAWFLPIALAVAGLAWLLTGDPVRAVAVLVVATPCPLLLAVPVAIVSGLSRASRLGVVVRGGGTLERLGHATTLVMDKTGTLTTGRPGDAEVVAAPGRDAAEVLRVAASAEQMSPHVIAESIVREAHRRMLRLSMPTHVDEDHGVGAAATVDDHRVTVGALDLTPDSAPWARAVLEQAELDNAAIAWVTIDDFLAGAILLRDPLRSDTPHTLRRLRSAGFTRMVMLTGDRSAPAEEIGLRLGLDAVRAHQTPADKVAGVRKESRGAVTVMVGDGVNDAPALAAAHVGVALGARGSTASSEAADIVLTSDRIDRLADAMEIARRSRRIAIQSATVGMGLSLVAMGFAAFGLLPPAAGALLQEGIDVAVIVNSLRAVRGTSRATAAPLPPTTVALLRKFSHEHESLREKLPLLRQAAGAISSESPSALAALRAADAFLFQDLLPHEDAEETALYPELAVSLGSGEATTAMSGTHVEMGRLARRIHAHLKVAEAAGTIRQSQAEDLAASLYGLHALARLHFAQEEENYFVLAASDEISSAASEYQ